MKNLRPYQIPYVGLKLGSHQFTFDINHEFFEHFQDSPITDCAVNVRLEFEKKETLFILNFYIDGVVNASCDRCLVPFAKEIFGDAQCIVKFSSDLASEDNDNDEIIYISRDDSHIDVSTMIYDYIVLCLPMQLSGCKEVGQEPQCNKAILERLFTREVPSGSNEGDPRWSLLKGLKFDGN